MASKFNIKVLGIPNVTSMLSTKSLKVKKDISDAMNKVALLMESEVKESIAGHKAEPTSVDTGRFLSSVSSSNTQDTATISSDVDYSTALEHGTSRMPARHHFTNSLSRNKDTIKDYIQKEIKRSL